MVKLTVLYDLPVEADHAEFIRWRTTEHHAENLSQPGVIKSDFYIVKRAWRRDSAPYSYLTESYFLDMATFEKSFLDPGYQKILAPSLERIANPLFLISEEVVGLS
jgi:hypothetical protein